MFSSFKDDDLPGERDMEQQHLPAQVRGHFSEDDRLLQAVLRVEGLRDKAHLPQPPDLHSNLLHPSAPLPLRLSSKSLPTGII